METLEQLRGKINSAKGLQSVVRTMKGLAAVNIRQYERAADSLAGFVDAIERGLQILLRRRPEAIGLLADSDKAGGPVAMVVFGSDQGMVGQFNQRLADAVREQVTPLTDPPLLLVVGHRLAAELTETWDLADTFETPGSVSALGVHVREILVRLEALRRQHRVGRVVVCFNRPTSGAAYEPVTRTILPLGRQVLRDLAGRDWPTRMLPDYAGQWDDLFTSLVRQIVVAELYRALAASLAAENASRLASMQAAERNIDERLESLENRYHLRRQSAITEELLDVTAGFEALGSPPGRRN